LRYAEVQHLELRKFNGKTHNGLNRKKETMTQIKTLTIRFNLPLHHSELPLFRGAIIAAVPSGNLLFHNHDGTTLRYAYPLIQYKLMGGKAAIVCIGEGVQAMAELLADGDFTINIGNRKTELKIESISSGETDVRQSPSPLLYHLRGWLPLNETNHALFQSTESMVGRLHLLEQILTGNILSLLKGLGIFIDFHLQTVITDYSAVRPVNYKHVCLTSMDLCFKTNILLPEYVGLGKHSSIGAGLLTKEKQNNL